MVEDVHFMDGSKALLDFWNLSPNELQCTLVSSTNSSILRTNRQTSHLNFWKALVPNKVKISMWLGLKNKLHTGKNLAKKAWRISSCCSSWDCHLETISHLFIKCPFARAMYPSYLIPIPGDHLLIFRAFDLMEEKACANSLMKRCDQFFTILLWHICHERNI